MIDNKEGNSLFINNGSHNTIKDPHWNVVQGSDTTMTPIAS